MQWFHYIREDRFAAKIMELILTINRSSREIYRVYSFCQHYFTMWNIMYVVGLSQAVFFQYHLRWLLNFEKTFKPRRYGSDRLHNYERFIWRNSYILDVTSIILDLFTFTIGLADIADSMSDIILIIVDSFLFETLNLLFCLDFESKIRTGKSQCCRKNWHSKQLI